MLQIPIIEKIKDDVRPAEIFEVFRDEEYPFFLDSGMCPESSGRYSLMGSSPFLIFKSRGNEIIIRQGKNIIRLSGSPLDILGKCLDLYTIESNGEDIPCRGGAVGYISYDMGRFIEDLPVKAKDDLQIPECYFAFYDILVISDNLKNENYILSTGFPETTVNGRMQRACGRLDALKRKLKIINNKSDKPVRKAADTLTVNIRSNFSRQEYLKAVKQAKQYIIEGDIFEVNLSQRFEADLTVSPYRLYRSLRQINPAPFAAYLSFPEVIIISSSPERFLKLSGDMVETRPIKGTIRRGSNRKEDEENAEYLRNSLKDNAENIMIVDLERNDLGRVCRYGSVKVRELAALEKYPTVFHLTSTIEGRLRDGVSRIDLLKATFPGGSITGAPKIRAMEIIEELEPSRRGVYTGSIGYFSFDGDFDFNIAIRTMVVKDGKIYFQTGGAVVFDSDPEEEYRETLDKADALIKAIAAV
jgi:para-aminobenzoate synthetase component I